MAHLSTKLQSHRSESSINSDGSKGAREYYVVRYDATSTTVAAETATGVPSIGAAHPDDSSRRVIRKKAVPFDNNTRMAFEVEVEYTNGSAIAENPLTIAADVTWSFSDERIPYLLDCSDPPKLVLNTAGEPFENLLEQDTGSVSATITKNIAATAFNPSDWVPFMRPKAVNSDSFTLDGKTIAIGEAKFAGVSCSGVQTMNGIAYRTLTITLDFAENWDHKIQSRGFNEKVAGTPPKLKEIVKGDPPTKVDYPWPLDADGKKKASAADDPEELTFKPQPARAFSTIASAYFA